jgi:hypothetical protein
MSLGILAAGATESACTTDEHDRSGSMTSRNLKCSEPYPSAVVRFCYSEHSSLYIVISMLRYG